MFYVLIFSFLAHTVPILIIYVKISIRIAFIILRNILVINLLLSLIVSLCPTLTSNHYFFVISISLSYTSILYFVQDNSNSIIYPSLCKDASNNIKGKQYMQLLLKRYIF